MIKKITRPTIPIIKNELLIKESWKIFQIISEFVDGYERLYNIDPAISIFGSARLSKNHKYCKLAKNIAKELSNAGFSIVTGGGGGIMEAANFGAYQGKSLSIGLNIVLPNKEVANNYQDISLRFRHFFSRKVMFVKHAKAYIVFPGGFGTLNELIEILVLAQTKTINKIPIILVFKDYWQGLIDWFKEKLVTEKMIEPKDLNLFHVADNVSEILKYIK
jgi:hypothetical protein